MFIRMLVLQIWDRVTLQLLFKEIFQQEIRRGWSSSAHVFLADLGRKPSCSLCRLSGPRALYLHALPPAPTSTLAWCLAHGNIYATMQPITAVTLTDGGAEGTRADGQTLLLWQLEQR